MTRPDKLPIDVRAGTYAPQSIEGVIFVGDAAMSPYEISAPGGSVEHFNEEPGTAWMERVTGAYKSAVWLNPVPESDWDHTQSIPMMRALMSGRMYPLTLEGLDRAMRELVR
jgi:uncharacterized protein